MSVIAAKEKESNDAIEIIKNTKREIEFTSVIEPTPSHASPENPWTWTHTRVGLWIRTEMRNDPSTIWTENEMNAYSDTFMKNQINGEILMSGSIDDSRLKDDFNVTIFAHRMAILKIIGKLKGY